jgi:hypothetical protein
MHVVTGLMWLAVCDLSPGAHAKDVEDGTYPLQSVLYSLYFDVSCCSTAAVHCTALYCAVL